MYLNRFAISVKGVLQEKGRFLLRKNERKEYELPGGRLEKSDRSFAERLCAEFLEESGISVSVGEFLEPWILAIEDSRILIIPYRCSALHIPKMLIDQDGGSLAWFAPSEIEDLPMPQGYKDSIRASLPRGSLSRPAEDMENWVTSGDERRCPIFLHLWEGGTLVCEWPLPRSASPREYLCWKSGCSAGSLISLESTIDWEREAVILNYCVKKQHFPR